MAEWLENSRLIYMNMFAKRPAGRPGTADGIANAAELLMSSKGVFITGPTILIDGGATASYCYGTRAPFCRRFLANLSG